MPKNNTPSKKSASKAKSTHPRVDLKEGTEPSTLSMSSASEKVSLGSVVDDIEENIGVIVASGNLMQFKYALKQLVGAEELKRYQEFALYVASGCGCDAIVDYLLAIGLSPNPITLAEGQVPLIKAILFRNEYIVKTLLAAGADPNVCNTGDEAPACSALILATMQASANLISILFDYGVDDLAQFEGLTALDIAINNEDIMSALAILARKPDRLHYLKLDQLTLLAVQLGIEESASQEALIAAISTKIADSIAEQKREPVISSMDYNVIAYGIRSRFFSIYGYQVHALLFALQGLKESYNIQVYIKGSALFFPELSKDLDVCITLENKSARDSTITDCLMPIQSALHESGFAAEPVAHPYSDEYINMVFRHPCFETPFDISLIPFKAGTDLAAKIISEWRFNLSSGFMQVGMNEHGLVFYSDLCTPQIMEPTLFAALAHFGPIMLAPLYENYSRFTARDLAFFLKLCAKLNIDLTSGCSAELLMDSNPYQVFISPEFYRYLIQAFHENPVLCAEILSIIINNYFEKRPLAFHQLIMQADLLSLALQLPAHSFDEINNDRHLYNLLHNKLTGRAYLVWVLSVYLSKTVDSSAEIDAFCQIVKKLYPSADDLLLIFKSLKAGLMDSSIRPGSYLESSCTSLGLKKEDSPAITLFYPSIVCGGVASAVHHGMD